MPKLLALRRRGEIDAPFVWLCALILSLSYELPLFQISSYDRINPRLFDIVSILGLPLLVKAPAAWTRVNSRILRNWTWIVALFVVCGIVWAFAVDSWQMGQYCLYYAGRYLQGLVVLLCVTRVRIDEARKKTITGVMIFGGIFVASYAVVEYLTSLGLTQKVREIAGGRTLVSDARSLLGPLSATYFHIGVLSVLSFAIALGVASQFPTPTKRWMGVGLALFVGWPSAFCGSRAALIGAVIVVIAVAAASPVFRRQLIVSSLVVGIAVAWFRPQVAQDDLDKSYTISRLYSLEESGNATDTIQSRLIFTISPADYLYGAVMPFIGSGFYVSPVNIAYSSKYAFVGDHGETYRVGYGIHNMYLFPFEQGGVVAFILFIMFLLSVHRGLKRACKETSPVNKGLAVGTRAFFYAMLIIGIGGQVFWNFDGNGNLLVYLIMTFMISTSIPTPAYQLIRPQDRGMLEMAQYSPRFAAAESTRAVAGR